jgi:FkbM family methyltransferase
MRIIDADSVVSRSLAVYGEWATDELNLLGQIITPGMCVLDIGAFIGTHTLAFSEFVGPQGNVYSFEPRKEIYAILAENISLNNLKNVTSLNIGLAEKEDVLSLQSLDISQGINFGGLALDSNDGSLITNTYQVRISTIDSLDIKKLDVIKLDVEGMERRVLDGAIKTVLRDRPVIFCECNSLIAGSEMLEFCKSMQYDVYGLLASAYNSKNFNEINDNFFGNAKELALVLIPRENIVEVMRNITDVNLLPIHNIEDLVLPLLFKPQYPYEVLAHTASCASLGIDFPSPALVERDEQITHLNLALVERDEQITHLNLALVERDEQITALITSQSWQLTKPLRFISRLLRGSTLMRAIGQLISGRFGIVRKSFCRARSSSVLDISAPLKPTHPTAVILPVYRGVEMTMRCILAAMPSVLADTDAKLLAINDASPDDGMQEMLEQLATQWPDRLLVLKNENNLGFVRTVNRGLAYFSQSDVILLNSDVIVPKEWISRLIDEAYSRPNIGTVTPFSNNATICSFPYFCQENAQPFDLDVDTIDAVFKHEKLPCIEAPTGVGFCMYIRRACLDKVGYLNEEKFGRGYGEENDLCQRALKSGWLNLISPNIYAFHEGGVSFSSDKQQLVNHATHVIDKLHPNYHSDVQKFIKSDPIKHVRVTRYVQLLAALAIPKVLHVSHSLGGGVKQHIEELGEYYGSRIVNILLAPYGNKGEVSVSLGVTPHADSLIFSIPSNYEHMLELLKAIGISAVHFHHTLGLDSKLLQLSTDLSVARLITVHDYYWLFGNPTLTDEEGKYPGVYSDQLHNPLYPLPHGMTVKAWQEPLHSFIEGADCVIFPSNSTKIIFDNVYNPAKSVVAPHIEPHVNVNTSPINFAQRDAYTIGVLGALGKEKGADILEELATKAKEAGLKLNFKLIGYAYRPLKLVEKTGPYETKELKDLIQKHQLDILLFTAQWPETYSYTLSYALDSGLPIFAPNIGAFPERLSGRTNVVLFNHLSPVSDLLNILNTFVEHMYKNSIVKAAVFENDISKHDFYSQDYLSMVSRDLKLTKISKQRPFHIDPTRIVAEGFMNKNSSWRNAVIHVLWRLRMSPYLRWFTNAIPPSVRRAVRHSLGGGNSHEIARGLKDK